MMPQLLNVTKEIGDKIGDDKIGDDLKYSNNFRITLAILPYNAARSKMAYMLYFEDLDPFEVRRVFRKIFLFSIPRAMTCGSVRIERTT